MVAMADLPLAERLARYDWPQIARGLDADGNAVLPALLGADECRRLAALYADETRFRSRVVMARHGYGKGEYRYFAYPLPDLVATLRAGLYASLAPLANRWRERLGEPGRFPPDHADYLASC